MRESFWGAFIIGTGLVLITFVFFFQVTTNTDEHNFNLIKETTEAAMYDALDLASYRNGDTAEMIRINREKFTENFIRRFAEDASLSNKYVVEFYDINEYPPKVSLKVKTKKSGIIDGKKYNFDIVNRIDAILEMPKYD